MCITWLVSMKAYNRRAILRFIQTLTSEKATDLDLDEILKTFFFGHVLWRHDESVWFKGFTKRDCGANYVQSLHLHLYSPNAQSQCLSGHYNLFSEQHSLSFIQVRKTPQRKKTKNYCSGERKRESHRWGNWLSGVRHAIESLRVYKFHWPKIWYE